LATADLAGLEAAALTATQGDAEEIKNSLHQFDHLRVG